MVEKTRWRFRQQCRTNEAPYEQISLIRIVLCARICRTSWVVDVSASNWVSILVSSGNQSVYLSSAQLASITSIVIIYFPSAGTEATRP